MPLTSSEEDFKKAFKTIVDSHRGKNVNYEVNEENLSKELGLLKKIRQLQSRLHTLEQTSGIGGWVGSGLGYLAGRAYVQWSSASCEQSFSFNTFNKLAETGFSYVGSVLGKKAGDEFERWVRGLPKAHKANHDYLKEAVDRYFELFEQALNDGHSFEDALKFGMKTLQFQKELLEDYLSVQDKVSQKAHLVTNVTYGVLSLFNRMAYAPVASFIGYGVESKTSRNEENIEHEYDRAHAEATIKRRHLPG